MTSDSPESSTCDPTVSTAVAATVSMAADIVSTAAVSSSAIVSVSTVAETVSTTVVAIAGTGARAEPRVESTVGTVFRGVTGLVVRGAAVVLIWGRVRI